MIKYNLHIGVMYTYNLNIKKKTIYYIFIIGIGSNIRTYTIYM